MGGGGWWNNRWWARKPNNRHLLQFIQPIGGSDDRSKRDISPFSCTTRFSIEWLGKDLASGEWTTEGSSTADRVSLITHQGWTGCHERSFGGRESGYAVVALAAIEAEELIQPWARLVILVGLCNCGSGSNIGRRINSTLGQVGNINCVCIYQMMANS